MIIESERTFEIIRKKQTSIEVSLEAFPEAEYILNNCDILFREIENKYSKTDRQNHWLDGYKNEESGRSTFHWAYPLSRNKSEDVNSLPIDMPTNWERWIGKQERDRFRNFAEKSGAILLQILEEISYSSLISRHLSLIQRHSYVLCRMIRYPIESSMSKQIDLLAPEHYDPSILTLLYGASQSGLELQSSFQQWDKAPEDNKSSVVIYGRWLEYIDQQIKATLHRVIKNNSKTHRFSLQCFLLIDVNRLSPETVSDKKFANALEKISLSYQNTFISYDPEIRWKK